MSDALIIKIADHNDLDDCYAIRREVFIEEQKVPQEIELDEFDAGALHFIVRSEKPLATARVLLKEGGRTAKIGRVAVVKAARGRGIGKKLMQAIEEEPSLSGVSWFALDAQSHALSFYERLGYHAYGDEFLDANIPHFHMKKPRAVTP
jgi:ElaA protein